MTLKKTIIAGALIIGATMGLTTATMAQPFYHRHFGHGYHYRYGPTANDTQRGGPGPRVEGGSGTGIGAER